MGDARGMLVYKILTTPQWDALNATGVSAGAPVDLADGYVHLSTAAQVPGTLARHFGGQEGLWLLALEAEGLADLRWEPSRGGDLFPHLYAPLQAASVLWAAPIPLTDQGHVVPGAPG